MSGPCYEKLQSVKNSLLKPFFQAEIVFLENSNMTSGQLARVSRNFAAGLPFAKKLREDTIFITSDVDLFIFNKAAVLPDEKRFDEMSVLFADETIHFYNNHTTRLKFRDLTFTMFNMGTIAANLSVWRDIMDIKNSDVVNGEYIEKAIQKVYGDEFAIKNKHKMFNWYLDQHFFSLKFHKYLEKNA
uniref:Nucleotid_trans domain-containing protein n=2 Tax=Bursaphelenchus xylophilus TaxID=6326 RepID=A0A1I7SP80_BURXY